MIVKKTNLEDVILIEPLLNGQSINNYRFESFSDRNFIEKVCRTRFVEEVQTGYGYGSLRGFDYQIAPFVQAALIRVIKGRVLIAAVDIRKNSPTFCENVLLELSAEKSVHIFIPRGFASAFLVLSSEAVIHTKYDNFSLMSYKRGIAYDDPDIGIDWPMRNRDISLPKEHLQYPLLANADLHGF